MLRTIVGEHMLIPVGDTAREFNGMITLTDTAVTIWNNVEKVDSEEELVEILLEEYEVDRETAARDVHGFIGMLKEQGMLE